MPFPSTFFVAEYVDILTKSPTASSFTKLMYLFVVPSDKV